MEPARAQRGGARLDRESGRLADHMCIVAILGCATHQPLVKPRITADRGDTGKEGG